jgi:hypothetical protein
MRHNIRPSHPYLEIFDHYPDLTRSLRQIDKGYFLVKKNLTGKLEVHNRDNTGPRTFCFVVPYPLLDSRTVDYCRMTYVPHRGREVIEEKNRHNEAIEKARDKAFDSQTHDISVDTAKDLTLAAQKDLLHDGYKRTHTV